LDMKFTVEPKLTDAIAQLADGSSPVRSEDGEKQRG